MKEYIEERATEIAYYIIETGATGASDGTEIQGEQINGTQGSARTSDTDQSGSGSGGRKGAGGQ